jgi:hypothetical protein
VLVVVLAATSKTSGMRCINRTNGHGFKASRTVARRF